MIILKIYSLLLLILAALINLFNIVECKKNDDKVGNLISLILLLPIIIYLIWS